MDLLIIRKADDLTPQYYIGKASVDCSSQTIEVWSMTRALPAQNRGPCPRPDNWILKDESSRVLANLRCKARYDDSSQDSLRGS